MVLYNLYKKDIWYMTSRRKIASSAARTEFADLINRAAYAGERVIVHRRKKPVAALVPLSDLELLEQLEDRIDLEDARSRLNEPGVSWTKIKKEMGL
jgi:prevent-host-death family protein